VTQVKSEGGARPESGGGPGTSPVHPFRHEAFFYASESELVAMVEPFVREGVEAGEDVLVAVDAPKGERLRKRLGPAAAGMRFADLTQLGSNPARLIPLWRSFLDGVMPETPCRGVGESVHSARSRAELAECLIHESLVNLAFSHDEALWLMCPCDSTAVSPETLEHLRRSHPYVSDALGTTASNRFTGPGAAALPRQERLPPRPAGTRTFTVEAASVVAARHLVSARAHSLGLSPSRTSDFTLAAHEVIANSLRHGGGRAEVSVWAEEGEMLCEVRDQGRFRDALAGLRRPVADGSGGRGLWMANQLCDLVQIRSSQDGTAVRLHLRLA